LYYNVGESFCFRDYRVRLKEVLELIKVRLKSSGKQTYYGDDLTGIKLYPGDVSEDLLGQDCREVIKGIKNGILEIVEGKSDLSPTSITEVLTERKTYDLIQLSNRSANYISIYCKGSADLKVTIYDGKELYLFYNQALELDLPVPVSEITFEPYNGSQVEFNFVVM
jgi:hypothetical protein